MIGTHMGQGYELIDVGASSGIVLASAFAFGAQLASGIELKNEGQHEVFLSVQNFLEKDWGIEPSRFSITYDVDVSTCTSHLGIGVLRKAVFAFCDGFDERSRRHMFKLVGQDSLVHLLVCSLGRGKHDLYSQPEAILHELNKGASAHSIPVFVNSLPSIKVRMCSSEKTLHCFSRM